MSARQSSAGLSLIEVVVFIVVLSIGFAAMLLLYNRATLSSVDPVVRKQAVAIANSLLEEITLRPFTFCDPDDANVFTANGPPPTYGCTVVEAIGKEPGETVRSTFDNVSDYDQLSMAPGAIADISGEVIPGLAGYSVQVSVAEAGGDLSVANGAVPGPEALLITVSVAAPAGVSVSLQAYRLRYAPNSP